MTSQLDLALASPIPEVTPSEVSELIGKLCGRSWQKARDLVDGNKESHKRRLRAIAEASEGQIISGQKGYKLTLEATPEEVAGTQWLRSQGRKMQHRWIQIQRVYHAAGAGAIR